MKQELARLESRVEAGAIPYFVAAEMLVDRFLRPPSATPIGTPSSANQGKERREGT